MVDQIIEPEFTKYLLTLGVGGVLAGFMFVFYRKDVKQYTELWRITAEQLIGIIKENTASNVKLMTMIESIERNNVRRSDIALFKRHMGIDEDSDVRATDHK